MTNLTLLAQSGQCFYRRLEGDSIIGSVQLIDVDTVQTQALQTSLERFGEMFRAGIVRPLAGARALPSTFGCDHQSSRIGVECFRDQLFGGARAVGVGRVNQIHAEFNRPPQGRKRSSLVCGRSPHAWPCDAHRAIAHPVDGEITTNGERAGSCG